MLHWINLSVHLRMELRCFVNEIVKRFWHTRFMFHFIFLFGFFEITPRMHIFCEYSVLAHMTSLIHSHKDILECLDLCCDVTLATNVTTRFGGRRTHSFPACSSPSHHCLRLLIFKMAVTQLPIWRRATTIRLNILSVRYIDIGTPNTLDMSNIYMPLVKHEIFVHSCYCIFSHHGKDCFPIIPCQLFNIRIGISINSKVQY